MESDVKLLRRYAHEASEDAFTALVARNIGLVYAVALRRTRNPQRAQDVTQVVFNDLARKAAALCRRSEIAGWLHVSAHYAATALVRTESRRERREHASLMATASSETADIPEDWDKIRPMLDLALCELKEIDRASILLRFFREHSFAEVGRAVGLSEAAARKRVDRALERLRVALARRGIASTSAALAMALVPSAGAAAPAGLAVTVASTALATGGAVALGAGLFAFMTTTKLILGLAGGVAVLAFGTGMYLAGEKAALHRGPGAALASSPDASAAKSDPASAAASASIEPPAGSAHPRQDKYRRLIDQLRRAGIPEDRVRLFVRAELESDLAAKKSQLMTKLQFWRETLSPDMVEAMRTMQQENKDLVAQFFGPAEALKSLDSPLNAKTYAYLPAELAAQVDRVRNDYLDLRNAVTQAAGGTAADRARQLALLDEQQQVDLGKLLTPEQLADYAMRESPLAAEVARTLSPTDATDAQFKDIFKIYQAAAEAARTLAPSQAALASSDVFAAVQKVLTPAQFNSYLEAADPAFAALKTTTDQLAMDPSVAFGLSQYLREAQASRAPPAAAAAKIIATLGPSGAQSYGATPAGHWIGRFLPRP